MSLPPINDLLTATDYRHGTLKVIIESNGEGCHLLIGLHKIKNI